MTPCMERKKNFNAADRKEKLHYRIGVPLIVINILTGSVLIYVISGGGASWVKFVPLILTLFSALLSGFQTYLKFQQKVEGHRRVGNRYLAMMKKCDRIQGYISDSLLTGEAVVEEVEKITSEIDEINREAESFSCSNADYLLAKKGIESGEETYTEEELNI